MSKDFSVAQKDSGLTWGLMCPGRPYTPAPGIVNESVPGTNMWKYERIGQKADQDVVQYFGGAVLVFGPHDKVDNIQPGDPFYDQCLEIDQVIGEIKRARIGHETSDDPFSKFRDNPVQLTQASLNDRYVDSRILGIYDTRSYYENIYGLHNTITPPPGDSTPGSSIVALTDHFKKDEAMAPNNGTGYRRNRRKIGQRPREFGQHQQGYTSYGTHANSMYGDKQMYSGSRLHSQSQYGQNPKREYEGRQLVRTVQNAGLEDHSVYPGSMQGDMQKQLSSSTYHEAQHRNYPKRTQRERQVAPACSMQENLQMPPSLSGYYAPQSGRGIRPEYGAEESAYVGQNLEFGSMNQGSHAYGDQDYGNRHQGNQLQVSQAQEEQAQATLRGPKPKKHNGQDRQPIDYQQYLKDARLGQQRVISGPSMSIGQATAPAQSSGVRLINSRGSLNASNGLYAMPDRIGRSRSREYQGYIIDDQVSMQSTAPSSPILSFPKFKMRNDASHSSPDRSRGRARCPAVFRSESEA
ncbi:hypothetical protein PVAG01_02543 [Phlyctema vagabunda]|uniref:Uncharacterized protein n=1 Tax=Phlyctema vagabunda TaxID=108571 RepID=A0ABR4PRI0_9HELO